MEKNEETAAAAEALRAAAQFVLEWAGDIEVEAMDYADNITRKYPSIRAGAIVDTDRRAKALCAQLGAVVAKLEAAGIAAETKA